jgi:hypothetical protein
MTQSQVTKLTQILNTKREIIEEHPTVNQELLNILKG